MQSSEPSIVERVAATFYNLMRQIYVEQVWRQNEQQPTTNPSQDRKKPELGHIRSAFSRISDALSSKYCLPLFLLTYTITLYV
jgi:hypothetical protein